MSASNKDYIVFGRPKISEEEIAAITATLHTGWIGSGPRVRDWEAAFAAYQGVPHATAVSSCTAALMLTMKAYGIGPGDEVITTAMTFAATVNAIIQTGATPVIVDMDSRTCCIDLDQAEAAITSRTRAIIPVHFAGYPVDMDRLMKIRERAGVKIIHDCAHAIETKWRGRRIAQYGDATCYSFYSTKNITTIEGGMICSKDLTMLEQAKLMSYQGLSKDAWKRFSGAGYMHYDISAPGWKLGSTDVQASLGLLQLAKIEERAKKREVLWERFQNAFQDLPIVRPPNVQAPHLHGYHLYTIQLDSAECGVTRDEMITELHQRGIGTGVHYQAIPLLSYFRETFGWKAENFPNALHYGQRTLSIPFTPYLSEEDVERVVSSIREVIEAAISRDTKRAA